MIEIFAETHRKIARNIHREIYRIYDIELDEKKLVWSSVSPDIYPKYKLKRHYADESKGFIVSEIVKLIQISRFLDFKNGSFYELYNKMFSRKLGIISHYLSDFVCRPHYERWTFNEALIKHVSYEKKLNEVASDYCFKNNGISGPEISQNDFGSIDLKSIVSNYIDEIIEEYASETGYENDLDFAYNFNLRMTYFILDTVELYNYEKCMRTAFVF